MNVLGEFKQVFDNDAIEMSPRIRCKAINCKHNEEKLCIAKNILVNGIDVSSNEKKSINIEKTQCETFEEE